jgi:hypothetical protein
MVRGLRSQRNSPPTGPTRIPKRPPPRSLRSPTASRQCRTAEFILRRSTGRFYSAKRARRPNTVAGLELAIARGWLELHESGMFVKLTQSGADLFA